jgi:hypothetical protein
MIVPCCRSNAKVVNTFETLPIRKTVSPVTAVVLELSSNFAVCWYWKIGLSSFAEMTLMEKEFESEEKSP